MRKWIDWGVTSCAVATTRRADSFSIDVVGPDAIPGCTLGATIAFRGEGKEVAETAVNAPGQRDSLNLTLP